MRSVQARYGADQAMVPAQLNGSAQSMTYKIKSLLASVANGSVSTLDISVAFNAQCSCVPANVSIVTVLS